MPVYCGSSQPPSAPLRGHEPADAALASPRERSPAACRASSAHAVCEAVLGPRPIHALVVVGARVLAPAAVLVLVRRAASAPRGGCIGSEGSTPAAISAGTAAPVP